MALSAHFIEYKLTVSTNVLSIPEVIMIDNYYDIIGNDDAVVADLDYNGNGGGDPHRGNDHDVLDTITVL